MRANDYYMLRLGGLNVTSSSTYSSQSLWPNIDTLEVYAECDEPTVLSLFASDTSSGLGGVGAECGHGQRGVQCPTQVVHLRGAQIRRVAVRVLDSALVVEHGSQKSDQGGGHTTTPLNFRIPRGSAPPSHH